MTLWLIVKCVKTDPSVFSAVAAIFRVSTWWRKRSMIRRCFSTDRPGRHGCYIYVQILRKLLLITAPPCKAGFVSISGSGSHIIQARSHIVLQHCARPFTALEKSISALGRHFPFSSVTCPLLLTLLRSSSEHLRDCSPPCPHSADWDEDLWPDFQIRKIKTEDRLTEKC